MNPILEVRELKKVFYKEKQPVTAVDNVSFYIEKGECLGLVGESGCGKSTTAKIITRQVRPDAGKVVLDGADILGVSGRRLKDVYGRIQMVFQTPQDSFDPRKNLGDGIMEGMRNRKMSKREAQARMEKLLEMVEMDPVYARSYPHEVSGGQCQRAAIARALAVSPQLIICDEATSALDVTVQAQIVELLLKLQREMGLSFLLISHDLALVQKICGRVMVMYDGKIIEQGTPDEIIKNPKEEYTRILVDSVF